MNLRDRALQKYLIGFDSDSEDNLINLSKYEDDDIISLSRDTSHG